MSQPRRPVPALVTFLILVACGFVQTASGTGLMDSDENRRDPGPPRNFAPPGARTHLVMLGTGNPLPDPHRYGPASAIVVDDTPYLVDAGEGVWRALASAASAHGGAIARAFAPANLRRLFVTHQHADHTIGIPALLMMPWYLGRQAPVEIWGPPGTAHTVAAIMDAWRPDVEQRAAAGVPPTGSDGWQGIAHDVDIAESGQVYADEHVRVEAFHHHHVDLPRNYAYRFTTPDRVLVIGGDGTGDERLVAAAMNADVFVMEVATEAGLRHAPWAGATLAEKEKVMWRFHIRPRELADIARRAKVKRLVLYHVQNYSDPFDPEALLKEVRQHYEGEVELARDGDIF